MASGPITSWQIDGETVAELIFLGTKITADGDCSHELIRLLLLGRKVMINLDSIFKSRDIALSTKVHFSQGYSFSSKEQACFNFMAAGTICSDFAAQENGVCHCFHCFPIYLP